MLDGTIEIGGSCDLLLFLLAQKISWLRLQSFVRTQSQVKMNYDETNDDTPFSPSPIHGKAQLSGVCMFFLLLCGFPGGLAFVIAFE